MAAPSFAILRQDHSYLVRQDGSHFARQPPPVAAPAPAPAEPDHAYIGPRGRPALPRPSPRPLLPNDDDEIIFFISAALQVLAIN